MLRQSRRRRPARTDDAASGPEAPPPPLPPPPDPPPLGDNGGGEAAADGAEEVDEGDAATVCSEDWDKELERLWDDDAVLAAAAADEVAAMSGLREGDDDDHGCDLVGVADVLAGEECCDKLIATIAQLTEGELRTAVSASSTAGAEDDDEVSEIARGVLESRAAAAATPSADGGEDDGSDDGAGCVVADESVFGGAGVGGAAAALPNTMKAMEAWSKEFRSGVATLRCWIAAKSRPVGIGLPSEPMVLRSSKTQVAVRPLLPAPLGCERRNTTATK